MSISPQRESYFRSDIQGLRGIAVLLVVIYHTGFALPGGFIGVDMFFVISGFVITQVLLREYEETGKISLGHFYARRARRLIPALSVVTIFTLLISLVAMSPFGEQQQIIKTALASTFFAGNIHLFAMNSYDALADNPLRHLWSLGVEEQFYSVYPLFFFGLMKFSNFRLELKRIKVCLWVVTACSFVIGVALTNGFEFGYHEGSKIERQFGFLSKIGFVPGKDWPTKFAFFGAPARFWEILVGVILAFTVRKFEFRSKLISAGLASLGLALVAWSSLTFDASMKFPGHLALLPVVGTALLILFNHNVGLLKNFLSSQRLVYLGHISYSLYLWHWPIIVFAKAIWPNSSSAVLITVAAVSLVPADLSYRLVESRFRKLTDKPKTNKILAIGLLAITPLFVSIVAYTAANTGLGLPVPWDNAQNWKKNDIEPLDGCLFGTRDFVGDCLFSVEEPKFRMMLLGDSNAGSARESVIAAANQSGGDVIISHEAGCPFNFQVKRDGCHSLNLQRLKFLEETRPSFVMLIASDMKYVKALSLESYLDSFKESLDLLSGLKIPVVVLGPIPDCHFPMTLYGKYSHQIYECRLDISDQSVRNSLLIKLNALTLRADNNVFIDPSDVVCPESKCRAKREIGWIYSDLNHLSSTGSKLLTPFYVDAIQKVLATKRP